MSIRIVLVALSAWFAMSEFAVAQTSSLGAKKREEIASRPPEYRPRESTLLRTNVVYERHSLISVSPPPPKTYKVHDLVTVIVRQSLKWEAQSDLKTERNWDLKSQLEAFPKLTQGGVGSSIFRRGKPNVDFKYQNEVDNKGDASREDRLTTRLTAEIIDVKPNGTLVLEGRGTIKHDEETSEITITGTCRKEDVTADNTVLSTQLAELSVAVANQGALKDTATRGLIPRLLDWLKPF